MLGTDIKSFMERGGMGVALPAAFLLSSPAALLPLPFNVVDSGPGAAVAQRR
jgi:hypothetical protein